MPKKPGLPFIGTPSHYALKSVTGSSVPNSGARTTMGFIWQNLRWFKSGERQAVNERLRQLDKSGVAWCPGWSNLYCALDLCSWSTTKVVLVGQDPYPNPQFANGLAFSIPSDVSRKVGMPPTLAMLVRELQADVDEFEYSDAVNQVGGVLSPWCRQGVLLWNAIPSCEAWKSKSQHWVEWEELTKEIFESLSFQQVVFAFLGSTAMEYEKYLIEGHNCKTLYTSHPSPRGNIKGKFPFLGSRLFSSINIKLAELGRNPIDWRLK